jgi:hypothetical protein
LAFQLTGPGSKGEARQRTLNYALANAARKRTEQNDSFGDTGAITHAAGLPQKQQSRTFDQVGGFGEFGEAAKDPNNRRYFEDVMGGLANFQNFMNPPQPGPSA